MAEITIIPSVRLYKTGLKTTQADGNTRSIALRQGSLDGACAVYSTIIALMCLRQINYEDVDTSNGNIDKRGPKGRFLSKLLEQRGLLLGKIMQTEYMTTFMLAILQLLVYLLITYQNLDMP